MVLKENRGIPSTSKLFSFHPLLDNQGLMRIGGRLGQSKLPYWKQNPVILSPNHDQTKLIIQSEHLQLLHAGPILVAASLSRRFCIIRGRRMIRSIVHDCIICQCIASKPQPQIMEQLSPDRLNPGPIFDYVGEDYAGPIIIKFGSIRKPTITKSYVAVFVCFSVKEGHLETDKLNNQCIHCNPVPFYHLTRQTIRDLERSRN